MSLKRRQQQTMRFASDGEVIINHQKQQAAFERQSEERLKSGSTLKLPAMTAQMVEKVLPKTLSPKKEEPIANDRFTEITDGAALLDQLTAGELEKPNQLTNEFLQAILAEDDEDNEPVVSSRPAGEYPTFVRPPTSPSTEEALASTTEPIQARRTFTNRRTRSILLSVGVGTIIGLAGVAGITQYDHCAKAPSQKNSEN